MNAIKNSQIDAKTVDKSVGEFFKGYREKCGYSLEYVSGLLGSVSAETLKNYESGDDKIPFDIMIALSNYLLIPPDELFELLHEMYQKI